MEKSSSELMAHKISQLKWVATSAGGMKTNEIDMENGGQRYMRHTWGAGDIQW